MGDYDNFNVPGQGTQVRWTQMIPMTNTQPTIASLSCDEVGGWTAPDMSLSNARLVATKSAKTSSSDRHRASRVSFAGA